MYLILLYFFITIVISMIEKNNTIKLINYHSQYDETLKKRSNNHNILYLYNVLWPIRLVSIIYLKIKQHLPIWKYYEIVVPKCNYLPLHLNFKYFKCIGETNTTIKIAAYVPNNKEISYYWNAVEDSAIQVFAANVKRENFNYDKN